VLKESGPLQTIQPETSVPEAGHYPIPAFERERLEALHAYHILDTGPEPGYDRIVQLAARLFKAPIATVSLVAEDRQWFKAKCGVEDSETSRELSFCTYAMLEREPMVVCDATRDPRFRDNELVTGEPGIRFYAGVPIMSSDGLPLGTLCVIDRVVRDYPPQNLLDSLTDLGFLVGELLEFRATVIATSAVERRHHELLEGARQAAVAANRAKDDFLARMSHEIRTPMNLIMGMNALLLESELDKVQRQRLEISDRNVRRLLRLINGILDLSKVEAGELSFQAIPFDLTEVLNECAATTATAIEQQGLQFETFVDLRAWRYWVGDPERVQQVLLNLIGNSIKFTRAGKIQLRVCAETRPLEVGGAQTLGLRFEISDTGCGVPKDKAKVIFEAFQQAEGSVSRSYEGTGLGLAISKTLVERMSGKIWVEEKLEPGAKFVFTLFLPKATEEAVRSRKSPEVPKHVQPAGGTVRILLVEDNADNVLLMQAYLDHPSISMEYAVNGLEALEKRQCSNYDLVFMDIQMPVMDGYTATRMIRNWEEVNRVPRVPIVALTAHAFNGASADSIEAGCDWHLTKPVERRDLIETISRFARPQQSEVEDEIPDAIRAQQPIYLSKRWSDLEKMREALATGDFGTAQKIGHNCKGTGAGYGFPAISRAGLEIEKACKAHDASKLAEAIEHFEQCLPAVASGVLLR
jgi:signal transduction histidine kinase/CheY-like chemotaxis protein